MLIVGGARPAAALAARRAWRQPSRSTQRPIGTIRPGLLGERDELDRARSARAPDGASAAAPRRRRCWPSFEPHDRLVVQLELVGRERALEVGAQLEAGEHALVHRGLEQRGSRPCRRAWRCTSRRRRRGSAPRRRRVAGSAIEMPMLRAQRELRVPGAHRQRRASRARARRRRPPPGVARCPRAAARTRRRRSGRRCRCAADARRRGAWRPRRAPRRRPRGRAQSLTVLKSSRSRKTTAMPRVLAARAGDRVADALGEQRAVGEPRHRVVERLVGELLPRTPCAR